MLEWNECYDTNIHVVSHVVRPPNYLMQQLNTTQITENDNDIKIDWSPQETLISIALFIAAGIFEIGGGYLVWKGVRSSPKSALYIFFGSLTLIGYGFVPTLQPSNSFGRVFAVYGGFFIVLSYAWAAVIDGMRLDLGDYIGAAIALTGVSVSWFWPRG